MSPVVHAFSEHFKQSSNLYHFLHPSDKSYALYIAFVFSLVPTTSDIQNILYKLFVIFLYQPPQQTDARAHTRL